MLNKRHYKHFINMFKRLSVNANKASLKVLSLKAGKAGFTLLEVIFAIFVISVGVMGAYSVIQKTMSETYQSSFRLTAAYLAQEGIEIVRNIRDNNWLQGVAWNNGLGRCDGNNFYQADYSNSDLGTCGSKTKFLAIVKGYYKYNNNGSKTPFIREIRITHSGTDEITVSVEVYWKYKGKTKGPITVQENLYKWHQ